MKKSNNIQPNETKLNKVQVIAFLKQVQHEVNLNKDLYKVLCTSFFGFHRKAQTLKGLTKTMKQMNNVEDTSNVNRTEKQNAAISLIQENFTKYCEIPKNSNSNLFYDGEDHTNGQANNDFLQQMYNIVRDASPCTNFLMKLNKAELKNNQKIAIKNRKLVRRRIKNKEFTFSH